MMERRVLGNWHARCGAGENLEIISKGYLSLYISQTVRNTVIRYVRNRYGNENVCAIMTTDSKAPKSAIRIAARYYGEKKGKDFYSLADGIAKQVPSEPKTTFETKIMGVRLYDYLITAYEGNRDAVEIIRLAKLLEGCFSVYGQHAAGVVIADEPIADTMPLRWNKSGQSWTTQCDMIMVEEKGYLKMDFLGLRTLDIITDCLKMLEQDKGVVIDPLKIDLKDEAVYREVFQKGNTGSVFQFESDGMRNMLRRFRPESFEDLIILVSMYRPGPLQYIDSVIDVKNGKQPKYLTPELEPILGKTYGGIVYQEQVMEIFQKLAGYTLGGADIVRRYMSKKKAEKLEKERKAFVYGDPERKIPGCVSNGIDPKAADALFEQMMEFASYAFNKSHAAAYAFNSYVTAWLKFHFPAEFLCAALNWAVMEQDRDKKISNLIHEANLFGVGLEPPDVNASEYGFTVTKDGKIRCGLGAIKSVSSSAMDILKDREEHGFYHGIKDFFCRTNVNKGSVESLIRSGAFDLFCPNRTAMVLSAKPLKDLTSDLKKKKEKLKESDTEWNRNAYRTAANMMDAFLLPIEVEEDPLERLNQEKRLVGAYVSGHPCRYFESAETFGIRPVRLLTREDSRAIGAVSGLEMRNRKKDGASFANFMIEDPDGQIDAVIYTKAYREYKNILREGSVFLFTGRIEEEEVGDEKQQKFIVSGLKSVPRKKDRYLLTVSSYPVFHIREEKAFKEKYEDADGHDIYLSDKTSNNCRKLLYKVNENALTFKGVSILTS